MWMPFYLGGLCLEAFSSVLEPILRSFSMIIGVFSQEIGLSAQPAGTLEEVKVVFEGFF